jgi:cytolysin (calcineurin-like family phosphatase)
LTDSGTEWQWKDFLTLYGRSGHDGLLTYPVYENVGNHDYATGTFVESEVIKRHGTKRYSWDWDALHIVSLADAPGDDGMDWLEADLKATHAGASIVVFFHYPLLGPWSETNWFGKGRYRKRLYSILEHYCVAGIFHGHYHASGHYKWGKFEVFNSGSIKDNNKSVLVVKVTTEGLSVAAWNYEYGRWWWWWRNARSGDSEPVFGQDERPGEAQAEFPYPLDDPAVE